MKIHPCPCLLLIYFTFNSSMSGIDFPFLKKWSLLYWFFLFALLRNHQILEQVEKIVEKQSESSPGGFCCNFPCYWKLMRKVMHLTCGKVYHRMGI